MEEPTLDPSECSNCNAKTTEAYCQQCGQSTSVHRITFHETLGDFFSSTFALEGPLLSTIRLLIVNPGLLLREFFVGKRKKYYKPVSFFVVLTAIYLILRALIQYDPLEGQLPPTYENTPPAVLRIKKAAYYMVKNINNIMFFLVFAIGFNHKLFFRKRYNLAEYVTMGFYLAGIYTLFGTLFMLFRVYVYDVPNQVALIVLMGYIFYAAISLHQRKSVGALIKYFLICFLSLVLYTGLGLGFSYLMVGN
ncbi:MAG: DUF3667 domain-containing protein [Cyclobacteriaceae bacterium]